jgi:hypothetical protein
MSTDSEPNQVLLSQQPNFVLVLAVYSLKAQLIIFAKGLILFQYATGLLDERNMQALSVIRASINHRRRVICRTSNLAYRHMYRHAIQLIDTYDVCKLFNAMYVA